MGKLQVAGLFCSLLAAIGCLGTIYQFLLMLERLKSVATISQDVVNESFVQMLPFLLANIIFGALSVYAVVREEGGIKGITGWSQLIFLIAVMSMAVTIATLIFSMPAISTMAS